MANNILKAFEKFLDVVSKSDDLKVIIKSCDHLRDEDLVEEGVQIEDALGKSIWKVYYPKDLLLEKYEKCNSRKS
eukprot:UN33778